jgi:hypothetical protein
MSRTPHGFRELCTGTVSGAHAAMNPGRPTGTAPPARSGFRRWLVGPGNGRTGGQAAGAVKPRR